MDRPDREDRMTLKVRLEGEMLHRFKMIKEQLGVENNPDVIRHLIKVDYEQLIAKTK